MDGGEKNTRFSYNLSFIVASLCTSYCNFIPPRGCSSTEEARESSHFSAQAIAFGNVCFTLVSRLAA